MAHSVIKKRRGKVALNRENVDPPEAPRSVAIVECQFRGSTTRYEWVRYDRVDSDSIPTGKYPRFLSLLVRPIKTQTQQGNFLAKK